MWENMNSRVLFFVPYFGTFPNTFVLWLKRCEINNSYNWIIFTDDRTEYDYPENVKVEYTSLQVLKDKFQNKLGFNISLDRPYKLCDYRPLYGYLFKEYLGEYSHWGYCDLDIFIGNLDHFITEAMLTRYSKINVLGHISIIKNKPFETNIFNQCDYKTILSTPRNCTFDEVFYEPNINVLLEKKKADILKTIPYCDIGSAHLNFHIYQYKNGKRTVKSDYPPCVFDINNSGIFQVWEEHKVLKRREIAYVHFQKRKIEMELDKSQFSSCMLIPNKVIRQEDALDRESITEYTKDNPVYYIKRLLKKTRNKLMKGVSIH